MDARASVSSLGLAESLGRLGTEPAFSFLECARERVCAFLETL